MAEQTLPDEGLARVDRDEAHRLLVERAARSLGVGTVADLADYHRLKSADARAAIADLEADGTLLPVGVEGWTRTENPEPAWLHRDARVPSRLAPNALLTPFDPARLVPAPGRADVRFPLPHRIYAQEKRRFGYYCLPLMVGGRLAEAGGSESRSQCTSTVGPPPGRRIVRRLALRRWPSGCWVRRRVG